MFGFVVCFLVVLSLYFVKVYLDRRPFFDFVKKRNAKGPAFLPVIGGLYDFLGTTVTNNYEMLTYLQQKYLFPAHLWIKHEFYYFTGVAEEMKIIFNSPYAINKAKIYNSEMGDILKNSLLILSGKEWKQRRKLHMKGFKPNVLKKMVPVINERSGILLKQIEKRTEDECLYHFFDLYFSRNAFSILFGFSDDEMQGVDSYTENVMGIQEAFSKRIRDLLIPNSVWLNLYPEGRRTKKMLDDMWAFLRQSLHKTLNSSDKNIKERILPQLEILVEEGGLTEEAIFQDLVFFMVAASDTSGHALAFCVTLLGMHPEIQEKLYQEVVSVIKDRPIGFEDLAQLNYTEWVILETLRILPVVPGVGRYTEKDIDLGSAVIPKGSNVVLCLVNAHLNPNYWPDPLKFDPTRFSPENSDKIVPYSYLPFTGGARDCVGKAFALLQLKITLAYIIRQFRMESDHKSIEEFEFTSALSMRTKQSLNCRFYPRK